MFYHIITYDCNFDDDDDGDDGDDGDNDDERLAGSFFTLACFI